MSTRSSSSAGSQSRQPRPYKPKVKTGCTTCRIRRIKCDEGKPQCEKCRRTGRTCDGYAFTIRQTNYTPNATSNRSLVPCPTQFDFQVETCNGLPEEIEVLGRYWTFASQLNLPRGYEDVAREALQIGMTEPAMRHALVATGSLSETFSRLHDFSPLAAQSTSEFCFTLQQYNKAVVYLAKRLARVDRGSLMVALICCRQFMIIETITNNYTFMMQHLARGLQIMYDCHARPALDEMGNLVRAGPYGMSLPDTFAIKLFSAPFPSLEEPSDAVGIVFEQLLQESRNRLVHISESTLSFLEQLLNVTATDEALILLNERQYLLDSLEEWLVEFEPQLNENGGQSLPRPRSGFLLLDHAILKVIITMALNTSQRVVDNLKLDFLRISILAELLTNVGAAGKDDVTACISGIPCREKTISRIPLDMGWVVKDPTCSDSSKRGLQVSRWIWRDWTGQVVS